jgi:hypothetical protein
MVAGGSSPAEAAAEGDRGRHSGYPGAWAADLAAVELLTWSVVLAATYEYEFVRLQETRSRWWGKMPAQAALDGYQEVVHQHAKQGWRLVQIFAPGLPSSGIAHYFELIFEREKNKGPA